MLIYPYTQVVLGAIRVANTTVRPSSCYSSVPVRIIVPSLSRVAFTIPVCPILGTTALRNRLPAVDYRFEYTWPGY